MAQTNILLESGTNELEIVEFYINEPDFRGHYGINVAKVVEIIRPQPITAMPQMRHQCIKGAFRYRMGQVVPLIDLSIYLGREQPIEEEQKIIVTEFNHVQNSFLVSGVNRIYRLSWSDVEAPGKFLQKVSHSSITGIVRLEGRVIFLLDLEAIIADLHPSLAIHMNIQENAEKPKEVYNILHADDSGSIRKLVLSMLNADGRFHVDQAVDGKDAWELLMAYKKQALDSGEPIENFLDGVITDIEMPHMDGLTLCRQIKEDATLKSLPVAVFSSLITDALMHKGKSVGADAQFAKPELQEVSDYMYKLIQDKRFQNKLKNNY